MEGKQNGNDNNSIHVNSHSDSDKADESQFFESESDHGVFFADAILDLEDAHDLADDDMNIGSGDVITSSAASSLSAMDDDGYGHSQAGRNSRNISNARDSSNVPAESNIEMPSLSKDIKPIDNSYRNNGRQYGRISNAATENTPFPAMSSLAPKYRPRPPRHLRDRNYTLAFIIFIPLSILLARISTNAFPLYFNSETNNYKTHIRGWTHAASSKQSSPYTHIPLLLSTSLTLIAARFIYKIPGGGEGENARYTLSTLFNQASTLAFMSHVTLMLQIYFLTPHAWVYGFFPFLWFVSDILIKRELCLLGRSNLSGNSSTGVGISMSEMTDQSGMWGSLLPGRRVFFQAMVDVSLDILSRSLRRAVFMRVIMVVLVVQGLFLYVWVGSFWKVLSLDLNSMGKFFLVAFAILRGWWTCSFFSRVLGLIASGGIMSWFGNQEVILQEEQERQRQLQIDNPVAAETNSDTNSDEYSNEYHWDGQRNGFARRMLDAYRTADASAYSCVRDYDEGIEDDYPQEDEFDHTPTSKTELSGAASNETDWTTNTTVKSFLLSSLWISSGSVIKCALFGSIAQYVQFSSRHILVPLLHRLSRRQPINVMSSNEFSNSNLFSLQGLMQRCNYVLRKLHIYGNSFVHNNSEYGMCHIAGYYKSYQKASNDVTSLITLSGVEPILHDDITSIMCSTVSTAITGWMSIFFFFSLSHHRGGVSIQLSDVNVCQILVVQYCICYVMLTTLLEPLRSSIQAVYVAFAQCPESMSHAFPLVYHRLRRISEGTITTQDGSNGLT